jgi:hypothetical protein
MIYKQGKAPASRGLFLISVSSIVVWVKLVRMPMLLIVLALGELGLDKIFW